MELTQHDKYSISRFADRTECDDLFKLLFFTSNYIHQSIFHYMNDDRYDKNIRRLEIIIQHTNLRHNLWGAGKATWNVDGVYDIQEHYRINMCDRPEVSYAIKRGLIARGLWDEKRGEDVDNGY